MLSIVCSLKLRSTYGGKTFQALIYIDNNENQSAQVEIYTAGDGINYPKPGQSVTIHYTGYVRYTERVDVVLTRVHRSQMEQSLTPLESEAKLSPSSWDTSKLL